MNNPHGVRFMHNAVGVTFLHVSHRRDYCGFPTKADCFQCLCLLLCDSYMLTCQFSMDNDFNFNSESHNSSRPPTLLNCPCIVMHISSKEEFRWPHVKGNHLCSPPIFSRSFESVASNMNRSHKISITASQRSLN